MTSKEQPKSSGMVSPAAEGTKYEPAVKKEQIPDGAWMCDMGTVHFAASEKGKGTTVYFSLFENDLPFNIVQMR